MATHPSSPEHLSLRTKMHLFRRKGAIIAAPLLVDVDIVKMRKTPRIVFALPPAAPALLVGELHFCNLDFTRFSLSFPRPPAAAAAASETCLCYELV